MPESYPVNWAEPMDTSFITDSAKMFMAARDKERARRLAADQEAYKRQEDEKDRQRQAVQDDLAQKRAQAADMWQADRHKLDVQAAKQKEAEFKLEMRTRQQKEALEKGAAFLEGNPQGAADVAKYAAIPETSDQYAAPPPDAAAQMPSAVAQPAVPGIEPGAPNLAEAQTLSPIQMARDRAAQEKRKQEEAIALYAAKQKAELANSETLAAAQARAAATASGAAGKETKAKKSAEDKLRVAYRREAAKPKARLGAMQRGLAMGAPDKPTAMSDYSLVYAFAKASDADSAVRESEFQGIKTQTGGWGQKAQQLWNDIETGKMTPEKRADMIDIIKRGVAAEETILGEIEQDYRELAEADEMDTGRIFGKAAAPAAAGGGSKADEIRKKYGLK